MRWMLPALLLVTGTCATQLATAAEVSAVVTKDGIEFKSGSDVVAKYATSSEYTKPFLYPVLAPGGVPVTRGWPIEKGLPGELTTDHVHQKSVWFCHGDVIPVGMELKVKTTDRHGKGVDYWSESKRDGTPRHGRIEVVKVGKPKVSGDSVSVETHNEWKTVSGVKIMDEVRVITLHEFPEGRLFTFDITLKASVCPIEFGDTKEGSFGVRVHDSLQPKLKDGAVVTTAEGEVITPPAKDNLPIWGKPAKWIDYSGQVSGKKVGITTFDHPDNPPASWHVRAYGLNGANPFGRTLSGFPSQKGKTELHRIEKGKELKLRYGVYAHTGDVKSANVDAVYEAYKK